MPARVLIVDDDKDFLDELEEMLTASGYDVITSNDAAKASEVAAWAKLDIILLDLKMPGKSGFQVADEIRRFQETRSVPIIAISAYASAEYGLLMKMCNINRCVTKPFQPLDLISEIENTLLNR